MAERETVHMIQEIVTTDDNSKELSLGSSTLATFECMHLLVGGCLENYQATGSH